MKVWVTKYALTAGILEFDTERGDTIEGCTNIDPTGNMLKVRHASAMERDTLLLHGKGKHWHEDQQSAYKQAEAMRVKRIAALQQQIDKLTNMILTIKLS